MAIQLGELYGQIKLSCGQFEILKYIITKQYVICNLEVDTDLYSNTRK